MKKAPARGDGEPISGRRFRVETMPKALELHLPESCPLL